MLCGIKTDIITQDRPKIGYGDTKLGDKKDGENKR